MVVCFGVCGVGQAGCGGVLSASAASVWSAVGIASSLKSNFGVWSFGYEPCGCVCGERPRMKKQAGMCWA